MCAGACGSSPTSILPSKLYHCLLPRHSCSLRPFWRPSSLHRPHPLFAPSQSARPSAAALAAERAPARATPVARPRVPSYPGAPPAFIVGSGLFLSFFGRLSGAPSLTRPPHHIRSCPQHMTVPCGGAGISGRRAKHGGREPAWLLWPGCREHGAAHLRPESAGGTAQVPLLGFLPHSSSSCISPLSPPSPFPLVNTRRTKPTVEPTQLGIIARLLLCVCTLVLWVGPSIHGCSKQTFFHQTRALPRLSVFGCVSIPTAGFPSVGMALGHLVPGDLQIAEHPRCLTDGPTAGCNAPQYF